MKKLTLDFIQHLASFLDQEDIKWEANSEEGINDKITIYYETEQQLFRIAFEFGQFYNAIDDMPA